MMPAKPLNQLSGMPQMGQAFQGWGVAITLQKIVQTIVNGLTVDTVTPINFQGTVQPLGLQQLKLKPEGERAWEWLHVHCFTGPLDLVISDKVIYNNKRYKVAAKGDYKLNNFVEYHLCEDFQ